LLLFFKKEVLPSSVTAHEACSFLKKRTKKLLQI